MTIAELGSLGELLGSIAVLCTLVYLAIQVKHAKDATRATLLQYRADASRELWMFEVTNPEVPKTIRSVNERMNHGDQTIKRVLQEKTGMTAEETDLVFPFLCMHFFHRQTLFCSGLTELELDVLDKQLRGMYSGGIFRVWFDAVFERGGGGYDKNFVYYVHNVLIEDGT